MKIGDTIWYLDLPQGRRQNESTLQETKITNIEGKKFTTEIFPYNNVHIKDLIIGKTMGSHILFFLTQKDYEDYVFRRNSIQKVNKFFEMGWSNNISLEKLAKIVKAIE